MSKSKDNFIEDVETLLEKVIIEEATQSVWQAFEKALNQLEPESRLFLDKHLQGISIEELSSQQSCSKDEAQALLDQAKRKLSQSLRKDFLVRQ